MINFTTSTTRSGMLIAKKPDDTILAVAERIDDGIWKGALRVHFSGKSVGCLIVENETDFNEVVAQKYF